jgi:hypothetical protein
MEAGEVWSRDDGISFLNLKDEADPDNLCPEGDLIKQFWKDLCWRRGLHRRELHYK